MDKMNKQILNLIQISFNLLIDNELFIDKDDWPMLYGIIQQHGIGSVLYPVIAMISEESKPSIEVLEKWENNILFSAMNQIRRTEKMKVILNTFCVSEIPVIVFKGPAIARFYQHSEYRSMSDLDIFVKEEHVPQAKKVIEGMGYDLVVDDDMHPMHFGYSKHGQIYIELHYALLEPGILGWRNMNKWYQHIWQNKKEIDFDGSKILIMPEEDELINQILHMATHMFHGGAKLRHIYDIALFMKKCASDLDWVYIEKAMKDIRLLKFGKLVFTTCHLYFGVDLPSLMLSNEGMTPQYFMERFLNDYCVDKAEGYQRVWNKLAWSKPFLCRNLFTLPIVYVLEFSVQVIKHKNNLWESFLASNYNIRIFKDRVKTLQLLGMNE